MTNFKYGSVPWRREFYDFIDQFSYDEEKELGVTVLQTAAHFFRSKINVRMHGRTPLGAIHRLMLLMNWDAETAEEGVFDWIALHEDILLQLEVVLSRDPYGRIT